MTQIFAHRGSRGSFPENTTLAFLKALQQGADGLELDVHLSKDGHVVVIHDTTIDRTTTGSGAVKDFTLNELRSFTIGPKYKEFNNYEQSWDLLVIPTLAEVLLLALPYKVSINIEFKTWDVAYPHIEQKVLNVVKQVGYPPHLIIYSAFHLPTLLKLKAQVQAARIAYLLEIPINFPEDYLSTLPIEAIHLDQKIFFREPSKWLPLKDHLRLWTVNEPSSVKKLLEFDVAAIITDYPEEALYLRNNRIF